MLHEDKLIDINSLLVWKEHMQHFPMLFEITKYYFSIPATSASSERCFSASGRICTESRSLLNEEVINELIVIQDFISELKQEHICEEFFAFMNECNVE